MNKKALFKLAYIYIKMSNHADAAKCFEKVVELDKTNGDAWGSLGHCYLALNQLSEAHNSYLNAISNIENKMNPTLWYGIGILYEKSKYYKFAEDAFLTVLKTEEHPNKIDEISFRLGIIYMQEPTTPERLNKAVNCFTSVLKNPPSPFTKADVLAQLGLAHELLADGEAKAYYTRAIEADPKHSWAHQRLGWYIFTHDVAEQPDQQAKIECAKLAKEELHKATEFDPNDGYCWYFYGRVLMFLNEHVEAFNAFRASVGKDSNNPNFWCSIGVLYFNMKQYRDSLDALTRCIKHITSTPEAWYNLGNLYAECKQNTDAQSAFAKAKELAPNNKIIALKLDAFRKELSDQPLTQQEKDLPSTLEPVVVPPNPAFAVLDGAARGELGQASNLSSLLYAHEAQKREREGGEENAPAHQAVKVEGMATVNSERH